MADNEAGVAEQGTEQEQEFQYAIKVEDIGPAAKKVTVEIPQDRIAAKLDEQYKELRQQAAIPGFRVGHAPRKLIEKRFADDVKEQVAGTLVRESYQQAVGKNNLQVIGEPEFDNADIIKLPTDGPLNYSFQVEVQPDIKLPDFANLKVNKPKITITEVNVDQAMQNLREQQGTLVPVEDRPIESGDYVVADVHLKSEGNIIAHQHDAQLVARPGRIAGLQVDDLDAQLAGAKSGDTRTITLKAPDTHPNEQLRGKDIQVEVAVKDIKKLELAEITPEFLADLGFDNEQELRQALREQMDEKIASDIQQAMREQVSRYLLENTQIELPTKMSDRQADRVVSRRAIDLMMRGIPRDQVEANVERLRAGAQEEAGRELKLFFILQKIATDQGVDVSEGELNGRVAFLAAQRERRPEKLKQEMQKDGSLSNLYVQMREQKAVDKILEQAKVEEVEMTRQEGEAAAAPAASEQPAENQG
ncbi:MAG TPA: trigger factor [Tepidisphaeraceae bacterium]|jgi:trigger factor|nr:trigger factor [Tepidisphaeraceae bacterium]